MAKFGKFVLGLVLFIIGMILGGLLISKFWGWFVIPIFTTLPIITLAQGIGLSVFISLFVTVNSDKTKDMTGTDLLVLFGVRLIIQLLFLLFGWIMFLIL